MDLMTEGIAAAAVGKGIEIAFEQIQTLMGKSKEIAIRKALDEQADLIKILENKLKKVNSKVKKIVESNLKQPDSYIIINKALKGTSQYSDVLKTEILAELIWSRLTSAEPNDVEAQIINDCISKIELISKNQLDILAAAIKFELSEDFNTTNFININYYDEWRSNTIIEKYFLERNYLNLNLLEDFSSLNGLVITPEDIFFIKSLGLAEFSLVTKYNDTFLFMNKSYKNTINKFPELEHSKFLEGYMKTIVTEVEDKNEIIFCKNFFRLNLNYSGLYLAKNVSDILRKKHKKLQKEREAKAKYNQSQYDMYNGGYVKN